MTAYTLRNTTAAPFTIDGYVWTPNGDTVVASITADIAKVIGKGVLQIITQTFEAIVPKVFIQAVGATLTRAANTTPYSIGDSISNNATPGSVTPLIVTMPDDANQPFHLDEIILQSNDTGAGGVSIRMHLYNQDPTLNSGVVGGDNLAFSNKQNGWIASFSGTMQVFSDGSRGVLVPDGGSTRIIRPNGKNIWYQLEARGALTPSANGTTYTPYFTGRYAR